MIVCALLNLEDINNKYVYCVVRQCNVTYLCNIIDFHSCSHFNIRISRLYFHKKMFYNLDIEIDGTNVA